MECLLQRWKFNNFVALNVCSNDFNGMELESRAQFNKIAQQISSGWNKIG